MLQTLGPLGTGCMPASTSCQFQYTNNDIVVEIELRFVHQFSCPVTVRDEFTFVFNSVSSSADRPPSTQFTCDRTGDLHLPAGSWLQRLGAGTVQVPPHLAPFEMSFASGFGVRISAAGTVQGNAQTKCQGKALPCQYAANMWSDIILERRYGEFRCTPFIYPSYTTTVSINGVAA